MYLVSLYFDEETDARIRQYINAVAKRTANTYMLDGRVPPHITVSAFETTNEKEVIDRLDACAKQLQSGTMQWASVGAFLPHVLYMAPVLNSYLHELSVSVYDAVKDMDGILIRKCYQPFSWQPHTTVGKKLSKEEMKTGFEVLQNSFGMFSGEAIRIGLAKTNPYEDIVTWKVE